MFESVSTVREVDNMRVIQQSPEPARVHDGCQVLWVSFGHPHSRVEAVPNRAFMVLLRTTSGSVQLKPFGISLRVRPEINISFCANDLEM